MSGTYAWAESVFGAAELGDRRRTRRLVEMAHQVALSPAGQVTHVFRVPADRQAAYDLLEHAHVPVAGVSEAVFAATARESADEKSVLVVLDGTSLKLPGAAESEGFGHIGTINRGARGLKVLNAIAIDEKGTPIGLATQEWWARPERAPQRRYRPRATRESVHWRNAVMSISGRFAREAPDTTLHFLGDREADATLLIRLLLESGHEFTIRSNANRNVQVQSRRRPLRDVLAMKPVLASTTVHVPGTRRRDARQARIDIRAARLPIVFRDTAGDKKRHIHELTVVWVHERRRTHGVVPLDWVLLTNVVATTARQARAAVQRYTYRWRIEDFHRTWKSGLCCVEHSQLRSPNALIKWATILAAVASRAERLRHRCRVDPEAAASEEFTDDELEAIALLADEHGFLLSTAASQLRLAESVAVVARVGGHVGNRGSGPPGTITISRGLERVCFAAQLLSRLRSEGRLR